ncbi:MAG: hypothetical protein DRO43_01605 [Candidatus Hecatellales archaeon]|nr:MAG: hypothetical protein DRO43_01605 [Candidatus Hecatellales archaeon]
MLPREHLEAILKSGKTDVVPVMPPFQGFWALDVAGLTTPQSFKDVSKTASAQLKVLEQCTFDGIEVLWDWLVPVEALGCKVDFPEKGNPITSENIVKSLEDVDKLEVPDIRKHARTVFDYEVAEALRDKIGRQHFTYITMPSPFTLAGELRGVESLLVDMMLNPADVHRLLKFTTEVLLEYLDLTVEKGFEAVFWCDPTASGDLISPDQFKEFSLPYLKVLSQKTKEKNLWVLVHICGDLLKGADRLKMIQDEVKPHLMSVDTAVDLLQAKQSMDATIILGNVSTTALLQDTPEKVYELSIDCVKKAGEDRFVLGAGCDIPVGSPPENVSAMIKAARA